jgi:hypothetical protein
VSGFQGVTNNTGSGGANSGAGSFDLLFNLGANYDITSVVVDYAEEGGFTLVNSQYAYVSSSAPVAGETAASQFSQFGATGSGAGFTNGQFSLTFTGNTDGQYVDLNLQNWTTAAFGTGAYGASIEQVDIYGSIVATPEPSTWALWAGGVLALVAFQRLRTKNV